MLQYFKSMADQDTSPLVICDERHTVIYMNPAACQRYQSAGGAGLLGRSLLECHGKGSSEIIQRVVDWFQADPTHNRVHTFYNDKENKDVYMIALRDEQGKLIGYYEKHEYRNIDLTPFYQLV